MTGARVGVAVEPPLLADLLVRLLSGPNLRLCRRPTSEPLGCDLAIVSPSWEESITAPRVIRLPDDHGHSGMGAVTTEDGSFPAPIGDVEAISNLLETYLPRRPIT